MEIIKFCRTVDNSFPNWERMIGEMVEHVEHGGPGQLIGFTGQQIVPSVFGAATYSTELMCVLEIVLVFVVIQVTKFHLQHGKIPDFAKAKKAIIGRFFGTYNI